ncbi:hypothetical protein F8M41_015096 [Gigaspora margarita]|uniref:Uncharacterized protein n=1 Tax=Gigaspora margarita TaxID=4874 RepID=A0A8H4ENP2_GIGMA|nr:hypothetical protein F8M41_015096 [Gigaspora margarita]
MELLYMLPHQRNKENWFPYVIFYECHVNKLRDHVMCIQKDKWLGYKKPFISKNLSETLLLPDEQPSLKKIEDDIENLKNYQRNAIGNLREQKNDIKELKELIEDMKTNK